MGELGSVLLPMTRQDLVGVMQRRRREVNARDAASSVVDGLSANNINDFTIPAK